MRIAFSFLVLSLVPLAPAFGDEQAAAPLTQETGASARKDVAAFKDDAQRRDSVMAKDERFWVVIRAASKQERTDIASLGVAIEQVEPERVAGIATREELALLASKGFVVEKTTPLSEVAKAFPPQDKAYHDYGQTAELLKGLASKNPGLASVFSVGKTWQKRDIWAIRLNTSASGTQASSKPGVLVMGTHHAREHLTTEVPLLMAAWLCEHKNDAEVKRLLETRDLYFIPMLNPDGVEYDVATGSYRWQRKNMRPDPAGVDINRNYGYAWGGAGASSSPNSETYRGPSGFSEPETQAVKRFVEGRPNLKTSVSYHSYGELVFYPWSYSYDPIPSQKDLAAYKAIAEKMASLTGYTAEQSSELYASSGDTDDWMYGERHVFGFTIELEGGSFYPGPKAIGPAVAKNTQAVLYLIGLADDLYRAVGSSSAPAAAR